MRLISGDHCWWYAPLQLHCIHILFYHIFSSWVTMSMSFFVNCHIWKVSCKTPYHFHYSILWPPRISQFLHYSPQKIKSFLCDKIKTRLILIGKRSETSQRSTQRKRLYSISQNREGRKSISFLLTCGCFQFV